MQYAILTVCGGRVIQYKLYLILLSDTKRLQICPLKRAFGSQFSFVPSAMANLGIVSRLPYRTITIGMIAIKICITGGGRENTDFLLCSSSTEV